MITIAIALCSVAATENGCVKPRFARQYTHALSSTERQRLDVLADH